MREIHTTGMICVKDEFDFEYNLSKIEYIEWEDETYRYEFTPNYSVMDLLPPRLFQGIPGLNLDLRKPVYIRENMVPVFISERTPGENRVDLWDLLQQCDMEYLNRLEWLIRTKLQYFGDPLYVKRYEPGMEKHTVNFSESEESGERSSETLRKMMESVCFGFDIETEHFTINDENRLQQYYLLLFLYKKEKTYRRKRREQGIREAVEAGKYKGRKPIDIPLSQMENVFTRFTKGKMSEEQALKELGVSRSTFYRRLREWRK